MERSPEVIRVGSNRSLKCRVEGEKRLTRPLLGVKSIRDGCKEEDEEAGGASGSGGEERDEVDESLSVELFEGPEAAEVVTRMRLARG